MKADDGWVGVSCASIWDAPWVGGALWAFLACGGKPVASPDRVRACLFRSFFAMIKELLLLLLLLPDAKGGHNSVTWYAWYALGD